MQINLPDNLGITLKAVGAGFADVESYLQHLIETDVGVTEIEGADAVNEPSYEAWRYRFDSFLASLKPGNPNFDDSRESIYPVR